MLSADAASITSALDPASSITVLLVNLPGSSLLTNSNKNRELPLLAQSGHFADLVGPLCAKSGSCTLTPRLNTECRRRWKAMLDS